MKKKEVICPIEFDESLRKKSAEFSVPGKPRGKERPRVVRFGNRITTYTPKNTVDYENLIKRSFLKSTNGSFKLENAIEANIKAIFPIPKSTSKKEYERLSSGNVYYTKKPDIDNICKSVLDGLNGIAYNDDSQVCKLTCEKFYGVEPRIEIKLKELKEEL